MANLLSNRPFCSNDLLISSERKKSRWLIYYFVYGIFLGEKLLLDIPVSQKSRKTIVRLQDQDWSLDTATLMRDSKIWYTWH